MAIKEGVVKHFIIFNYKQPITQEFIKNMLIKKGIL
jgi:hypothetical protein